MALPKALKCGLAGAALAAFACVAAVAVIDDAMCETTVYARSSSPNGRLSARVQMADCGATTGFSRVVYVQPGFLPDSDTLACRALALKGEPNVRLSWTVSGDLLVSHEMSGEPIDAAETCFGARIERSDRP